jgi:2-methylcitrate dehydratase PrpD
MTAHTKNLAAFAANLRYEDIPQASRDSAKACVQDNVGDCFFGARTPWTQLVIDYAEKIGKGGNCTILGSNGPKVNAAAAALANGTSSHAFEMDTVRVPATGVHPGGSGVPPAMAVAEELGSSGKDLITAFVAGMEVMTRVGLATHHSSETKGFHAPGLTGTVGAAVAAGKLYGLDAEKMTHAIGISGSLCSGLMEHTQAGNSPMVKRLHVGRGCESGVMAANLAATGFEGPVTMLEGKYGYMNAFAINPDLDELSKGLGEIWQTETIGTKRCALHGGAQGPVQALEELREEHGFGPEDIEAITYGTSEKICANHNIKEPVDLGGVQFGIPFAIAMSAYRDVTDPYQVLATDPYDETIRALAARVTLELDPETKKPGRAWWTRLDVTLKDGRKLQKIIEWFRGSSQAPLTEADRDRKFRLSTAKEDEAYREGVLARIKDLENQPDMATLLGNA